MQLSLITVIQPRLNCSSCHTLFMLSSVRQKKKGGAFFLKCNKRCPNITLIPGSCDLFAERIHLPPTRGVLSSLLPRTHQAAHTVRHHVHSKFLRISFGGKQFSRSDQETSSEVLRTEAKPHTFSLFIYLFFYLFRCGR